MMTTHIRPKLTPYIVTGGVAGSLTATGVKVRDEIAAVLAFGQVSGGATTPPNFEIRTNFDIQNGDAFTYQIAGVPYSLATDQAWDTGTVATTAIDTWIGAILTINAAGTTAVVYTAGGHADEAAALTAIAALVPAAGHVIVGYVTILTDSGATWTAGTDALQGGTGGGPSDDTNYYNGVPSGGLVAAGLSDLTSEFSISAANTITNAGGTATTGSTLLVLVWESDDRGGGYNRS
jgi:hypothetical protein